MDLESEDLQHFLLLSLFEPHQLCGLSAAVSQASQQLVSAVKVAALIANIMYYDRGI